MSHTKPILCESHWPRRLAVVLVCATFPLIWIGGLVTTYDAGMAVPDWPNTYGYNLFAYPWQTWLAGPWDLFIEHGHRLLGALVGLITIALTVSVWRHDSRRWMRYVVLAALAAVILQGLLGGARVLVDQRQLAKLHGCLGPSFFALAVLLAVFTSRRWRQAKRIQERFSVAVTTQRLAVITAILAFMQLVIGAQLRHIAVDANPQQFRILVVFHVLLALVLAVHVVLILGVTIRLKSTGGGLCRPAVFLTLLLVLQLFLGAGTWIVKYGWPSWFVETRFASGYTVESNSWIQANLTTAHVATGSLILAVSTCLAARSLRLLRRETTLLGVTSAFLLKGVTA